MRGKIAAAVMIIAMLLCRGEAFAAFIQTEGHGARPTSMGGAFIAVADGPEAVFYNPAGLAQVEGVALEAGAFSSIPSHKYTHRSNGISNKSDQSGVVPYQFISCGLTAPVYFGFGMYAPFGGETDHDADTAGGFGNAYALAVRVDYSPVIALKINDRLSVGGGFIAGQAKTKQIIQTAYGSNGYVTDEIEGWGYSGLVGALCKVNEHLKIGVVYRGRMDTIQKGQREMTVWPSARDSKANVHFPATAGIGVALTPDEKITLAFDADWNEWSYLDKVVTKIEGATPDMTSIVDGNDTVDYRFGLEFRPDRTTALRCGFMYIPAAIPGMYILPAKPDYERTYAVTFGAGKSWKKLELGLLYMYRWSNKWDVTDNAYGYNGRYEFDTHFIAADVKYAF